LIDISVCNLQKFFGDFELLKDITFALYRGEKVGLIGKNGAGKTTLFKILCGVAPFDGGELYVNPDCNLGIVDQLPVYPADITVEQVLNTAFARFDRMKAEIAQLETRMATDSSRETMRRYGELVSRFEHEGGYDTGFELEKIINGLDLGHLRHQPFYQLSGGEQTRVNLGRVILEKTDILLLDEPTNHLDIDSVEWLGEYLSAFKGTVLLISHDRYFLDQVCSRIIEVVEGVSTDYNGNYSYYAVERERRYQESLKLWESQMEEKQRLEALARKYRNWATEANMKKALVVEHKISKMTIIDRPRKERKIYGRIGEADFRAAAALKLRDVRKRYDTKPVIENASGVIGGGERVCIYGPNGCGKTTLLRMIVGELTPDAGSIRFGLQTKWAYLPQIVEFERKDRNVLETMLYALPVSTQEARDRLGAFKFTGEDVYKPISALSGGERSRLKLCMLMHDDLNFLILDEPTNHLDLDSREWMEEVLEGFGGVILFVSHDRYFVSRFATRVWELRDGVICDYKMGFERYRLARPKIVREQEEKAAAGEKKAAEKVPAKSPEKEKRRMARSRDKLEKEATRLEQQLEELETQIEACGSDYQQLQTLLEEKEQAEEALLNCYDQLEQLS